MPAYAILDHPEVVSEDIPAADAAVRRRAKAAIGSRLAVHPERHAKPLAHTTERLWSLRVGDWRVVFALREQELWVLRIGHRSEVYELPADRATPPARPRRLTR